MRWFLFGISVALCAADPDGSAIFLRECATCHNGAPDSRAPSRETLADRSPEAILAALTRGSMRPQGSRISGIERRAVAEFLSGKKLSGDVAGAATGRCTTKFAFNERVRMYGFNQWTSWGGSITNRRFQPAPFAGLTPEIVPLLKLKWALGFPDATSAWSQPTISGGRLFVGSQNGTVFSLDARSGCIYWTYSAKSGVRGAVVIAPRAGGFAAYFADTAANAYAVDAETGKELWSRQVETHPFARISGSPVVFENRVYMGVASFEELFGAKSHLRMLHVSRQHERARRENRCGRVENIPGSRTQADRKKRHRQNAMGTLRRRHLVGPDHRSRSRPHLRRNRQHLYSAATRHQ